MKTMLKKYRAFLIVAALVVIVTVYNRQLGMEALRITAYSFREMIFVIPPVFLLLGLLDTWVPKEIMMRYMGDTSGIKGIILAVLIGSAAAGPLYGAFPVAAVFMKKGVKFSNILIFIGAWSTTKIPMFLFETASLGTRFALTRLLINLPGIIIIAKLLARALSNEEVKRIYEKSGQMD